MQTTHRSLITNVFKKRKKTVGLMKVRSNGNSNLLLTILQAVSCRLSSTPVRWKLQFERMSCTLVFFNVSCLTDRYDRACSQLFRSKVTGLKKQFPSRKNLLYAVRRSEMVEKNMELFECRVTPHISAVRNKLHKSTFSRTLLFDEKNCQQPVMSSTRDQSQATSSYSNARIL